MTDDPTNSESTYTGMVIADRYEVGRMTAKDATTTTHTAQDLEGGATVTIRFLSPQLAEDGAFAERFVDDALWATAVKGPNIISILDAGTSGDIRYVVQEHVEGQSLGQKLKSAGKLDPATACEIADQVLCALAVAHDVGIVHGDINPSSIIMTGPASAQLMDLGLAHVQSSRTVAETQAVTGHPEYISPEQAQGESADLTTDIYSMGIVLYEMLTGRPPFSGDSPVVVSYMHIHDLPKPITQLNPDVPTAIADTVAKALLKDPEERYQTAEEFRSAIDLARSAQRAAPATAETTAAATEVAVPKPAVSEPAVTGTEAGGPGTTTVGTKHLQPKTLVFTPGGSRSGRKALLVLVGVLVLIAGAALGMLLLKGESDVTVPVLAQMKLATAEDALRQAGLKWNVTHQESSEYASGTVMGQAPASGATVPAGTEVVLTIAKTPSTVRVPDLVGVVSATAARSRLDGVGLQLGTITEKPSSDNYRGSVIEQDPLPDTVVDIGATVNIVVAAPK
jgi:serine/threonine-protein kinase